MQKEIQKYLSILANRDGKRKEKTVELSNRAQEIIKNWAIAMKEIISDYHQHFEQKLQDLSNHLSDYYEKFIAESKRLIDLSIRKSHMFLRHITELPKELLQSATANDMSLYSGLLQKNLLSPSNFFLKQFSCILLLQLSFHIVGGGGGIKLYVLI